MTQGKSNFILDFFILKSHIELNSSKKICSLSLFLYFRNKAKLLSHVLNPSKKSKFKPPRDEPPDPIVQAPPPKSVEKILPDIPEKRINTRSGGKRKELSKKYLRFTKI